MTLRGLPAPRARQQRAARPASPLHHAYALHRAGDLDEAARRYDAILEAEPANFDALQLRASVHVQRGEARAAIGLYDRALAVRPDHVSTLYNRALALQTLGRLDEAVAAYDAALARDATHLHAQVNRGNALRALKRPVDALASYDRALALAPDDAQTLNNRAVVLLDLQRADEALAALDRALELVPQSADALSNRGNALTRLGRCEEAIASYERALALAPTHREAQNNRAAALEQLGHASAARAGYAAAVAADDAAPETWLNRGTALRDGGDLEGALASYEEAARGSALPAEAHAHAANVLAELGRDDEAAARYDLALQLDPQCDFARWNRALHRLGAGRYDEAWPDYEARWAVTQRGAQRDFAQPLWLGDALLEGKTLLLHAEQGLGDTLQFCRYAPLFAAIGARVILEVQPELVALLRGLPGVADVIARGTPLPDFDFHCPLLSLPLACRTAADTIPRPHAYLRATPERLAVWAERLGPRTKPRVGLAWSGSTTHVNDRHRSLALATLAPALREDVDWIVLQKDVRPADLATLASLPQCRRFDGELHDFADTAALAAHCDLVVTVDTSIAHLAGALGLPTWILLPHHPDWRWLKTGETSAWYPSARLLRQPVRGDWAAVVGSVQSGLAAQCSLPSAPDAARTVVTFDWGVADHYGWGVYGLNLLNWGAHDPRVRVQPLSWPPSFLHPVDPLLARRIADVAQTRDALPVAGAGDVALISMGNDIPPRAVGAARQVGVIFFEANPLPPSALARLREYDAVITGSTWNHDMLLAQGIANRCVIQGIDTDLFRPQAKRLYRDRFVVFSGGKLEYRKGQDLVVRAFAAFAQRHPDALLVAAWSSPWSGVLAPSINRSGVCLPLERADDMEAAITRWAYANGIPERQFLNLGPVAQKLMPDVLREADLALFPNRCEGGTNLVAMEAMSAGLTCALSRNTGHLDLIQPGVCLPLERQRPVQGTQTLGWGESDVDELVAVMEAAHAGRARLDPQAVRASVAGHTWEAAIADLLAAVTP